MAKYIENFVTAHGIKFEPSKRNLVAFEKANELWHEIWSSLEFNDESIIMLCGARNNGKSSLMRYLINSYNDLNSGRKKHNSANQTGGDGVDDADADDDFEMIDGSDDDMNKQKDHRDVYAYLIDCDPGQAEITSPGIISAHIIRASAPPLQTPPYMNIAQHEPLVMSSVGGTNMSVNPRMFIDNSRFIFNKVIEHREQQTVKRPIFINTMGHIRNVGLAMLMDLIKICRPTNLIVLNVEIDPMRTIYADLSPKAIASTRAAFFYETNQQSQKHKLDYRYDIHNLQFSFVDSGPVASRNRAASQMAYMATIPEALYKPIMQLSVRWLSLKKVSVYCVSSYPLKEGIVLELLHHSWVHLVKAKKPQTSLGFDANITASQQVEGGESSEIICKIHDDMGENTLYGCGIVADIDLEKRQLAVITPLMQATLDQHVDCVIKPLSIQVPHQMIQ